MPPIAKPASASFAVKSVLCQRIVASAGWFTCAGSLNAFRIVQVLGIVMSFTANGHVQPADIQSAR